MNDQSWASLDIKIGKPKTARTRERDLFQLPVKNRFSLLSQELQVINNAEAGLNINAPEYVPIANRQVKQEGQVSDKSCDNRITNKVARGRISVKAPLIHNDVTNENNNKKVRQCSNLQGACQANPVICDVSPGQNNLADTGKVNQHDYSKQILRVPYQATNEAHSTARHNTGMLCDNAGAASQCKSGGGSVTEPKGPVTLNRFSLQNKNWGADSKNQSLPLSDDKYSLAIHSKAGKCHLQKMAIPK